MFYRKNKFFQDLDYLTAKDIEDNKITYDKLVKMNKYFEKDKVLTYSILLEQREDIDEETKKQMQKYIELAKEEENKKLKNCLDILETKNYTEVNIKENI